MWSGLPLKAAAARTASSGRGFFLAERMKFLKNHVPRQHEFKERVMTKREDQKRATREKLLIAAAECFAEKGYSGCSVSDIAARAEVSQGALYTHFKSKEELFKTMIRQEHAQGADKARQAALAGGFLDGIINILSECIRDVGFPVDHRLWTEILAVAAREEAVREVFLAGDRVMRERLVELLRKAADAGEIDASLDLDAVSVWLYALVDGLIARTADDTDFDVRKHLRVFGMLARRALRP